MKKTKSNVDNTARDKIINWQTKFGELGFTLTSDFTYYKDYGVGDNSVVRLMPRFDGGTDSQRDFSLTGFSIVTNSFISVDKLNLGKLGLHHDCTKDIISIMSNCGDGFSNKESFIIEEECSVCATITNSFIVEDDKLLCMDCIDE